MTELVSVFQQQQNVQLEWHAEMKAIVSVHGDSFTHCMQLLDKSQPDRIAISFMMPRKGTMKEEHIRFEDVYEAFGKFAVDHDALLDACQLTGVWESLTESYVVWLTSGKHTDRYRHVSSADDLAWLHVAAYWTVARRIMLRKYQQRRFINEFAFYMTAAGIESARLMETTCRAAWHVLNQHPTLAQELINEIVESHRQTLQTAQKAMQALMLQSPQFTRITPLIEKGDAA